jgi:hypothetical protein
MRAMRSGAVPARWAAPERGKGGLLLLPLLGALALLFLLPEPAWAFGPATHAFLSQQILETLWLLPGALGDLIRAYPQSFIYGSIAADISLAKKYVPAGRHCHYWHVGEEIYSAADNERMQAVALGYLTHLAADTIAHNYFVPRRLLLTSSTKALGHSYWEHRLDAHLGEKYAHLARSVVLDHDHTEADTLFDRVLSGTIFSFETNRRIFRGMIQVQDSERWKMVFDQVVQRSRWDLSDEDAETYLSYAFDSVIDYLLRRQASLPAALDPIGDINLHMAKKVRRMALREGAWRQPERLIALANDFFPLPTEDLGYWRQRGEVQS